MTNLAGVIFYKGVKLNSPKWQLCGPEDSQSPQLDHQLFQRESPLVRAPCIMGDKKGRGLKLASLGGTYCSPGLPTTTTTLAPEGFTGDKAEEQVWLLGTLSSPGGRKW